MALETFVAGRYSGAYATVDVGITEAGYELEVTSLAQNISPTDLYGQSIIDFVYQGANCFLRFVCKAYKAGSIAPFWPWAALGELGSAANPIGRIASDVAAAMVLSSTANTTAAAAPASLTGSKAILAPNNPARLLFNSVVRDVPVNLILLPYVISGGSVRLWTTT